MIGSLGLARHAVDVIALPLFLSVLGGSLAVAAVPPSPAERDILLGVHADHTGRPYRLAWAEYHAVPIELHDELQQGEGTAMISDPDTEAPLFLLFERTALSDGGDHLRLDTRDMTLMGRENAITSREIMTAPTKATIPASPSPQASLIDLGRPSTPERRREIWAMHRAPFEYFATLRTFREEVVWVTARLLEAEDLEIEQPSGTGHSFSSEFWRVGLKLDALNRPTQIVIGNPDDQDKRPVRRARYTVLDRYDQGPARGQPLSIRKELLWPTQHKGWFLNYIAHLQPLEINIITSSADFAWQSFAETAMISTTGEILDANNNVIGQGEKTTVPLEEFENQEAPASTTTKVRKLFARQNGFKRNSGSLSTVFVVAGVALVLVGGGFIVRNHFTA